MRALLLRPTARAALVALLALGAYAGSLQNGFVFDDRPAILRSPIVQGEVPLSEVIHRDWWGLDSAHTVGTYRPLAVLSLALDWRAGGGAAWISHLGNVLLHALAALLAYLVWRSLAGENAAFAGALLLAVLAAPSEAVEANVGRSDLLEAVFLLLGLVAYRRAGAGWTLLAGACALLAMGCKESALVAPVAWVAIDLARPSGVKWRERVVRLVLAGAAAAVFLWLRSGALGRTGLPRTTDPLYNPLSVAPPLARMLGAGRIFVERYLAGLFDPTRRLYDCSARACMPSNPDDLLAWVGVVLLVALALAPVILWRRAPAIAAALAWCAIFFLPVTNLLVPATLTYGERLLYVPLLGGCVAIACGVEALARRSPAVAWGALALVGVGNLVAIQARHGDWHDERALYESGLKYGAESVVVQQNNASAALDAHDPVAAEAHARKAVELVETDPYAHKVLAVALHAEGRNAEAEVEFRRALALQPRSDIAADFAGFLARQHRYDEALSVVLEARGRDPSDAALQDLERRLRARIGRPGAQER